MTDQSEGAFGSTSDRMFWLIFVATALYGWAGFGLLYIALATGAA